LNAINAAQVVAPVLHTGWQPFGIADHCGHVMTAALKLMENARTRIAGCTD
jgi:hypothetical protein